MTKTNNPNKISITYEESKAYPISVQLGGLAIGDLKQLRREAYQRSDKQDRNTAASERGEYHDDHYGKRPIDTKEADIDKFVKDELAKGNTEEEIANELLGEESVDEIEGFAEYSEEYFADSTSPEPQVVIGGEELQSQLKAQKRAKNADPYETRTADDGDYGLDKILDGMHVIRGHKGQ